MPWPADYFNDEHHSNQFQLAHTWTGFCRYIYRAKLKYQAFVHENNRGTFSDSIPIEDILSFGRYNTFLNIVSSRSPDSKNTKLHLQFRSRDVKTWQWMRENGFSHEIPTMYTFRQPQTTTESLAREEKRRMIETLDSKTSRQWEIKKQFLDTLHRATMFLDNCDGDYTSVSSPSAPQHSVVHTEAYSTQQLAAIQLQLERTPAELTDQPAAPFGPNPATAALLTADPPSHLGNEQKQVFSKIMKKVQRGEQVLEFVCGPPGTGKTYLVNQIVERLLASHLRIEGCAPTGKASTLMRIGRQSGQTFHTLFGIPGRSSEQRRMISKAQQEKLFHLIKNVDLIVIDEAFMLSATLFAKAQNNLVQVHKMFAANNPTDQTRRDPNQPFLGMHILMVGDPFQIPPIGGASLFSALVRLSVANNLGLTQSELSRIVTMLGATLFSKFRANFLTEMQRSHGDIEFQNLLKTFYTEKFPLNDAALNSIQNFTEEVVQNDPKFVNATYLVATNVERHMLNSKSARRFARRTGQTLYKFYNPGYLHSAQKFNTVYGPEGLCPISTRMEQLYGDVGYSSYFVVGAPGLLLKNIAVPLGLANGTACRYHSFVPHPEHIDIIANKHETVNTDRERIITIPQPKYINVFVDGLYEVNVLGTTLQVKDSHFQNNMKHGIAKGHEITLMYHEEFDRFIPPTERWTGGRSHTIQSVLRLSNIVPASKLQNSKDKDCQRLSVTLTFATTIHKAQGMNMERAIVVLYKKNNKYFGKFTLGQIYVALSRVRQLKHVAKLVSNDTSHLQSLCYDNTLLTWKSNYDSNGQWRSNGISADAVVHVLGQLDELSFESRSTLLEVYKLLGIRYANVRLQTMQSRVRTWYNLAQASIRRRRGTEA